MSKSITIIIIVILIILGFVVYKQQTMTPETADNTVVNTQTPTVPENEIPPRNDTAYTPNTVTITYSDLGFSPKNITVDQGDIVVFKNTSSKSFWPASDDHPDHRIYPEFDSKKPVPVNESFTFTFDKVGSWSFHNHSKASDEGTVTVNEI